MLAFLSLDRVAALWIPIKYKTYGRPNIAVWVTLALQCFGIIMCFPVLTMYEILNDDCFVASSGILTEKQKDIYVFWIIFVGLIGVPFCIISVSDILIIFKLKKLKGAVSRQEKEITVSLVFATICFLVLNLGIGSCLVTTAVFKSDTYRQYHIIGVLNVLAVSIFA